MLGYWCGQKSTALKPTKQKIQKLTELIASMWHYFNGILLLVIVSFLQKESIQE